MILAKSFAVSAVLAATLTLPITAAFAARDDMSSAATSSSPPTAGYTEQTNQQFVESCVKAASPESRSFCQCLIRKLRSNVPYQQFSAMDREYRRGEVSDETRSRMAQAAKACTSS